MSINHGQLCLCHLWGRVPVGAKGRSYFSREKSWKNGLQCEQLWLWCPWRRHLESTHCLARRLYSAGSGWPGRPWALREWGNAFSSAPRMRLSTSQVHDLDWWNCPWGNTLGFLWLGGRTDSSVSVRCWAQYLEHTKSNVSGCVGEDQRKGCSVDVKGRQLTSWILGRWLWA